MTKLQKRTRKKQLRLEKLCLIAAAIDFKGHCFYCTQPLPLARVYLDHAIPRSQGGTDTLENIRFACSYCNYKKTGLTDLEYLAGKPAYLGTRIPGITYQPQKGDLVSILFKQVKARQSSSPEMTFSGNEIISSISAT